MLRNFRGNRFQCLAGNLRGAEWTTVQVWNMYQDSVTISMVVRPSPADLLAGDTLTTRNSWLVWDICVLKALSDFCEYSDQLLVYLHTSLALRTKSLMRLLIRQENHYSISTCSKWDLRKPMNELTWKTRWCYISMQNIGTRIASQTLGLVFLEGRNYKLVP